MMLRAAASAMMLRAAASAIQDLPRWHQPADNSNRRGGATRKRCLRPPSGASGREAGASGYEAGLQVTR